MLDRIYELPLSKGYVRHWGVVEAVRELFQNALDSDSPFEYSVRHDVLRITSRFARLEPKTLLLGTTSKADAPDKIGSFGEGYKIAMLVLVREGIKVRVINRDRMWTPEFRKSRQFEDEVLTIRDSSYPEGRGAGLTFELEGLSEDDHAAIRASNLHMWDSVGRVSETPQGRILWEHPGKLFVNGLFVCDTDLKYGYDMKPQFLRLERDRQTVSTFDLQWLSKEMWFATQQHDHIASLIEQDAPDLKYANYDTPEVVKEACYRLFRESHPGKVVATSQKELDQMVAQGMQRVVVLHETFGSVVRSSSSYAAGPKVALRSPKQVLEDWFASNRRHMRKDGLIAFRELLSQSAGWQLK